MSKRSLTFATLAAFAFPASAAYIDLSGFDLGITSYDGWGKASEPETRLTRANYPAYATLSGGVGTLPSYSSPWPEALGSNTAGSGDALFNKTSGSAGFASSGAYQSNAAADFTVYDLTALPNLKTVVFQMEVNYYEFSSTSPVLRANGVDYSPVASMWFAQQDGTGVVQQANPIFAYQWDLSGAADPIASFEINWSGPASNGFITSLELVQGTNFVQAVPEVSSLACAGLAAGLFALRRRR